MKSGPEHIHGYTYGTPEVSPSPVSLQELESLQVSVGFTTETQTYLRMAGEVLTDQTRRVVER